MTLTLMRIAMVSMGVESYGRSWGEKMGADGFVWGRDG